MKFWQYAVGILVALFIFAAILIADNMQFSDRNTFSQNPFSLIGTSHAPFGGDIQFLPSGEMVWIDDGSELIVTEKERRLVKGTVALGGTFFPTQEDTAVTNNLWFGNTRLKVHGGVVIIKFDENGIATVLSGGGSVDLFFDGQSHPFLLPTHSQVVIDTKNSVALDPYVDYFELQQQFSLMPLLSSDLLTKLWQVEQALADWRAKFGHFAWNLPSLWEPPNGQFLQFIERIAITIPLEKQATRTFQRLTSPLREAHATIDEPSTTTKLKDFRQNILSSSEWKLALEDSEQSKKEWTWFEFAQKLWLPVVSPDAVEQKFAFLWKENADSLEEQMSAIELLSHNERWLRAEKQLEIFAEQFSKTEFTEATIWELVCFRREVTGLLDAFPIYRSASNFRIWTDMVRREQKYVPGVIERQKLTIEIAHAILRFVPEFLSQESGAPIVQILNTLWLDLELPENQDTLFSAEELTTIQLINLVGESGMTPEQARKAQEQAAQQDMIDAQLKALQEQEKEPPEEVIDFGISNAKKLWEFLASENIDLDISVFRTTRTEMELTTRFANTAEGKQKIEGVFDYHAQNFITLTLGEETISDLPTYRLARWIKNIGGKFEPIAIDPVVTEEQNQVIQTSPQAVLGRKLVQELLKSLGIEVDREQIEMKDEQYQTCVILGARYKGAVLNAEYNLLTQEFSQISLKRAVRVAVHPGILSSQDLINTLDQLLITIPDKN